MSAIKLWYSVRLDVVFSYGIMSGLVAVTKLYYSAMLQAVFSYGILSGLMAVTKGFIV